MIEYFKDTYKDIWTHVLQMFPMECCGIILHDSYMPCKNIALDPYKTFKIDKHIMVHSYNNGMQAIIHSHIDCPYLSKEDMDRSEDVDIPWGVAFINDAKKNGIYFWGSEIDTQELIERPFVYGIYDCYTLVKDYYKVKMNVELPPVKSDYNLWGNGDSLFEKLFPEFGFVPVNRGSSFQKGDVFMWAIGSKVTNHIGVYDGDGRILHHLNNRLSSYCDMNVWGNSAKCIVRKELC